jgi:CubicO group peptidase (beta-lactamase class C family)
MTVTPELRAILRAALDSGAISAGAVVAARDGEKVAEAYEGRTRRWDSPGVPAAAPGAPVTAATRFDLASLTKPIVAAAVLAELYARGADETLPVAEVLPEFRRPGASETTVADLLTHTAGLPSDWRRRPGPGSLADFRAQALPIEAARTGHRYSCVGYIWAGLLVSTLSERPLEQVVRTRILDPLGMAHTGYLPTAVPRDRIVATEFQTERGLVHGEVHDEAAWALGGVAGNAGLFGTADDLLRFAEALRVGAAGLPEAVRIRLVVPRSDIRPLGYEQAVGLRVGEAWMRGLGSGAAGHTGFTGTAFALQPEGRLSVVFLATRVHPSRRTPVPTALRTEVVDLIARKRGGGGV